MIRNENEYKRSVERVKNESERLAETGKRLKKEGLGEEEIKRVMDPLETFHLQLKEEIESYERLKRGEFDDLVNLRGLGQLLISLRISKGITQAELASRLEVSESQVSRDERNEYHGISLERATRILEALGAKLYTKVELESPFKAA